MDSNLAGKVSFALNENRTLILGSQVLLGFQFEVFFEKGFHQVPALIQNVEIIDLVFILASTVLLMAPTCFHRILGADEQTPHVLAFTTSMVEWALHPMALALGFAIFASAATLAGLVTSIALGAGAGGTALLCWFIVPWIRKLQKKGIYPMEHTTPVKTRLEHVLTESRVLLPGAQALLGFQLITFFMEDFINMARPLQWVHLISLLLITVAVILLIAPAAFHRIADSGDATERSYEFGSKMVLASSVPLGLGLVGELFLILAKTVNGAVAAIGSGLALVICFGLWFGYALYVRSRKSRKEC
jgi:hypothetical protein